MQPVGALITLLAMVFAADVAHAQTVTISVSGGPVALGQVSGSASGTTVLRITPAGSVSVQSGTGKRVSTGTVNTPSATVKCVDGNGSSRRCSVNPIYISLRGTSSSGPAVTPNNFTLSSSAGVSTGPTGTTTTTYKLTNFSNNQTRTFDIGMDVGVDPSSIVGAGTFNISVAAGFSSPASSPSDTETGSLYGLRPLSLSKTSDLAFGRIVKPTTGSADLTITTGGARNLGSGSDAVVLAGSSFSRAQYTATGEGGQAISISAPAFNMTNGTGGSVTVTPILPAGLTGIGGSSGATGTYTFYVGGKFTITPTTPSGGYTGSFNTTVAYN